ncbi:MAG TPA: G5 domain-containing protein [Feifaniaceae bacterium]|nr:G5 domain-containing protein [Feifaniaceae bacterium]
MKLRSAPAAAGAFLLRALLLPFHAVSLLFQKRGTLPQPAATLALAADGIAPETAPGPQAGRDADTPASNTRARRTAAIALTAAIAASALFLGWTLVYSDTSIPLTVRVNGRVHHILTKAQTVEELLSGNGIALQDGDVMDYEPASALLPNMEVTIESPFPVAVSSRGEVSVLQMREGSVGAALQLAGVTYDADDELTALPYADVEPGMLIRHIDVETEYMTVDEVMEFDEEIIKDGERYIGDDKLVTAGEDGEKRTVRRIVYRDGVLSSREIMNQIILKESVDEVKIVGTKIRYQTSLTGDTRLWKPKPTKDQIKKTVVAEEVTAYTHTGSRTATGRRPRVGYVAVNPDIIPYGTKLYIPGYGYCTAQDTGAFRHEDGGSKNQVDLFMETEKECKKWGRKRNVTIYILK